MQNLINNKILLIVNLFFLLIAYPAIYLFDEVAGIDISIYYGTFYCVALMILLKLQTGSYLSPVSIFLCFYWIMLMGRPFLFQNNLITTDIVEASASNLRTILAVNTYIVITLITIGSMFMTINLFFGLEIPVIKVPELELSKNVKVVLWVIFISAGLLMLRDGRTAYYTLQEASYIELIETGEIVYFNQTYYTFVKWAWFFLYIAYPKKSVLLTITFIVFLMALPVSGMRGYFILYLLMGLMFLEGKKILSLKLTIILPFIFGLLTLVTFLLEYRIGFSVTEAGLMAPVYKAIFDQGSTYEVVYGAFAFRDKISFIENVAFPSLFNFPSFGYYVDKLRGVNFANDVGFATSAIAETISGGIVIWLIYIAFLSFALNILHRAYINLQLSNSYYFTLFFLAPIIWGQPRGALLQFLVKFLFFLILVYFSNKFKIRKIKL